jgi:tetratricopeptide (TPR) repeat protein
VLLSDAALLAQKLGQEARAAAREAEALEMLEALDVRRTNVGTALARLAETAHLRGEHVRAVQLLERSVALARARGIRTGIAETLTNLGASLLALGDANRAAVTVHEALELRQTFFVPSNVSALVAVAAAVAARQGQAGAAARLLGAAEAQRERHALLASALFTEAVASADSAARAAMGEEAFTAAYAEGRALSLDDAVALAVEQTASV